MTTSAKIGTGPEWWVAEIASSFAKSPHAFIEFGRKLNECEATLEPRGLCWRDRATWDAGASAVQL